MMFIKFVNSEREFFYLMHRGKSSRSELRGERGTSNPDFKYELEVSFKYELEVRKSSLDFRLEARFLVDLDLKLSGRGSMLLHLHLFSTKRQAPENSPRAPVPNALAPEFS